MEFEFCQCIQQYDVIMTSNYVIVSVKLCLKVGNNDYIILCNFGGRIMSGRSKQKQGRLDSVNATVHTPQSIHLNESVDTGLGG